MLFVFWFISSQKFSHFVPVIFASQFSLSRRTNGAGSGRGCHQLRWDFYDSPLPRLSSLARVKLLKWEETVWGHGLLITVLLCVTANCFFSCLNSQIWQLEDLPQWNQSACVLNSLESCHKTPQFFELKSPNSGIRLFGWCRPQCIRSILIVQILGHCRSVFILCLRATPGGLGDISLG